VVFVGGRLNHDTIAMAIWFWRALGYLGLSDAFDPFFLGAAPLRAFEHPIPKTIWQGQNLFTPKLAGLKAPLWLEKRGQTQPA
tara:strand:- start:1445 stop:1693 length:249 start_codon:yes stop_codon:yes gene_type:complete